MLLFLPKPRQMLRSLQQHTIVVPFMTSRSSLPSFFFLLSLFYFHFHHHAKANHIFIYAGCSQEKYQQNSPFENNLNSLLSSIVTSASQALYNSFAAGNGSSGAGGAEGSVYGLYQCRGDLETKDCSICIANLVSQIELICPYNYGATLQLDSCFVRYEHMDFLGRLDTSLMFKKCSKRSGNDVEFLKRRDDVLGNLQEAGSGCGFRVSTSGSVEGYAQCVGDLSAADCSSCLADAITQLRGLCGAAAAADVFLAQCYARYWASGNYDSSDFSGGDNVGRTVAIVVGVVAGAAIMIVLLSICRKVIAG